MTNYSKWLIQSRAMVFTGGALLFVPTFAASSPHVLPLGLGASTTTFLVVTGIGVLLVGMLDSLGLLRRKWVKAAIREENERMRPGSRR